jgi:hypothetical protein
VEGPGRPVRKSGPFYTLAYFYYTTIYHLLPLLASVWLPVACESGGLVGMVNTNLEKSARQDPVTSIAGATVAGGNGRRPPNNIKSSYPLNHSLFLECRPVFRVAGVKVAAKRG